ncbi:Autophagy-related 16 [Carabus blaptoides fortunei]
MNNEENGWRKTIISQLQERNRTQTQCFHDLITFHNRLFDNANALRVENIQLSIQNEKLRISGSGSNEGNGSSNSTGDSKVQDQRLQVLEQKLLAQQEELTELHRRKGENAQQIIDLNKKLQEKEKQLASLDVSLADSMAVNTSLRAEIRMFQNNIRELENLNQVLRDEHQALQLAFAALEEKLRRAQDENRQLVERLIRYKSKDADKMNEENENFLKKRQAKMQKELEEAAKDTRGLSPDTMKDNGSAFFSNTLPTNATIKFDAHDGEVNAVKWSPADRIVATGGADRKVKLWDVSKGTAKSKGVLVGSNAGVMSVDFDSTGTLCLGASNDFASRVWTVSDQRLKRHRLNRPFVDVPVPLHLLSYSTFNGGVFVRLVNCCPLVV